MSATTAPSQAAEVPSQTPPPASNSSTEKPKTKTSPLRSIIAGSSAGAVEIAITYPAEFAKTRTQLNQRLSGAQKLPWPPFGPQWYAGCTTLIIGNSIKAGVRFVAFDEYKRLLGNGDGTISGPMTVVSGFMAGATESLLAVTPFESIKTQLIDDRKREKPRMRGFLHGSAMIFREQGIRGFFKGFVPTTARQAANSAVRFSTYTSLKQIAQSYVAPGEKLGAVSTFAIGGAAGVVTVYATQPIDTVKTRMQSLDSKGQYRNSIDCGLKILRNEGVFKLWSGALPRLGRLIFSGGIVFTMYEKTMDLLENFDPERKYI
ncbi:mitochondrial carrier [Polychaeton citri CBS 116435]|uniref:Mitochondrial carrier n=1 Tax=Polychaeton citri CBS 116435 TaxID=1314669 RepID=A0A9P4QEK3_9PEZI|nr:mitochondrial carrier [Polychaeton citri CBS 116435]